LVADDAYPLNVVRWWGRMLSIAISSESIMGLPVTVPSREVNGGMEIKNERTGVCN
jgi:hypothetical protein